MADAPRDREQLALNDAATHLLEECRMVLPGIQALFGFQMIAVFNSRFRDSLSSAEQWLHFFAIAIVVVAIALIMAPAALQRHAERYVVTRRFIELSSRLVTMSLMPLAVAICLDVYVVARMVSISRIVGVLISCVLMVNFAVLWLALPRRLAAETRQGRARERSGA